MDRKTVEITSADGTKVTINAYLTAREMQEINLKLVGDQSAQAGEKPVIALASAITWEQSIMEKAVVSVGDNTSTPTSSLFDLPSEEYQDLKEKIFAQLKINLTTKK